MTTTLFFAAAPIEVSILLAVCWRDIVGRIIPNRACLALALVGVTMRAMLGSVALLESVIVSAVLFAFLLVLHWRSVIGGGDVKLLTALALGQSWVGTIDCLTVMALAGGLLSVVHLALRRLPRPGCAPVGSSVIRRVYAAERWRIFRRAPLPYGVAIACGGMWTMFIHPGS